MTKNKNKQGHRSHKNGKGKGKGSSGLNSPGNNTATWNAVSQHEPYMQRLSIKDNTVHRIVQSKSLGNQIGSLSSSSAVYSKNFTTGDIQQYSSFASVFDQYKFVKCEIWLTPFGPGTTTTYANTTGARFYTVTDYDDSNNLTSSGQAMQYENVTMTNLNEGVYRSVEPHIAVAAYGGAFTQFKNEKSGWIDVASSSVQHYGVKCILDPTVANNDVIYYAMARITVHFRNVF